MGPTHRPAPTAVSGTDPARTIIPLLRVPQDTVRCAAARALAALGVESAAGALAGVLMDPDPDLRADAMAALAACARPEDAPAIRRSLAGDPVAEVKSAAIRALARLGDMSSVPLLRALALDRCEAQVAWEDPGGGWDDWLDVQVQAIEALGAMGVEAAVDDLLEARGDEMGQDLDHVVFTALSRMPVRGTRTLHGFLEHADAHVRERALDALAAAGREAVTPLRESLVRDPSPRVRRLAIGCFDEDDETLAALARNDPAASVRTAAIARTAPGRPEIGLSALRDPDENVRAVALETLAGRPGCANEPDLATNVEAWVRTAGTSLATVCAAVLPGLAGTRSCAALGDAALDGERHMEVRIAALRSLGGVGSQESVDVLRRAATDRSRQVRLAALAALADLSRDAPGGIADQALTVLVEAARGSLEPEAVVNTDAGIASPPAAPEPEQRDPRTAGPGTGTDPPRLRPDPDDGAAGAASTGQAYPRSTLEAIGASPIPQRRSEAGSPAPDDAARSTGRAPQPGRAAVEGPEDVGRDLRLTALRLAGGCAGEGIEEALVEAAVSDAQPLRTAALEAIARRAAVTPLAPGLTGICVLALTDGDAPVRAAAARALASRSDAADHLAPLLDDADDSVRATAVKAVAAADRGQAARGFRDPSAMVRNAALEAVAGSGRDRLFGDAIRAIVEGGFTDTLDRACRLHPGARQILLATLRDADTLPAEHILTILDALGRTGREERHVPATEPVAPAS